MVQNASMQQGQFGTINRVGMTQEGRAVYQVISADGRSGVNVSIPAQDCDRFERAYTDMLEAAPKLEKYMQENSSPDAMKKLKRRTVWTIAIPTLACGLTPAILMKKPKFRWKALATIGGTIAGFVAGAAIASKVNTPPGSKQFTNASKVLSEIDVKPLE